MTRVSAGRRCERSSMCASVKPAEVSVVPSAQEHAFSYRPDKRHVVGRPFALKPIEQREFTLGVGRVQTTTQHAFAALDEGAEWTAVPVLGRPILIVARERLFVASALTNPANGAGVEHGIEQGAGQRGADQRQARGVEPIAHAREDFGLAVARDRGVHDPRGELSGVDSAHGCRSRYSEGA
jgi:hypothetical protein